MSRSAEELANYRDKPSLTECLEAFAVGRRVVSVEAASHEGEIRLTLDDGVVVVIESGSYMSPGLGITIERDTPKDQPNQEPA